MKTYKIEEVRRKLEAEIDIPDDMLGEIGMVVRIMYRLRGVGGCPWDRVQTHKSLLRNLLEETYEFVDTVESGDDSAMCEELGDLLMQVVFQAEIAAERDAFDLTEVARGLADKLIRRHRHVFGDISAQSPEEALNSWNNAKSGESEKNGTLENVPKAMPALLRARKVQEKAANVGFDWSEVESAMEKLDEELAELKHAVNTGDMEKSKEELGDLLFAVVNVARFTKQCPEVALTKAVNKFLRRFKHIENRLAEQGRTPSDSTLEEMDVFWEEAKKDEKTG